MADVKKRLVSLLPTLRSWGAYAALPAVGIVTAPLLARALGPDGRGALAAVLQPLTLASAFAAIGIPAAVTFFIGRGYARPPIMRYATEIGTVATVIVGAFLVWYSKVIATSTGISQILVLVIWLALIPSAYISNRRAEFQGQRDYFPLDVERALSALLRVIGIVLLFLLATRAVPIYAAVYMGSGLLASFVLLRSPKNADRQLRSEPLRRRTIVSFAGFASVGTIANAMNSRLDQAIMPAAVSTQQLGLYSVAVAVSEVPIIITLVMVRNVLAESSHGLSPRHVFRTIATGAVAQFALAGLVALVTPFLMPIVFGKNFDLAISSTQILLLSVAIGYLGSTISTYLAGLGKPLLGSLGSLAGVVATVALFIVFWSDLDSVVVSWIAVATQAATLLASGVPLALILIKQNHNKDMPSPLEADLPYSPITNVADEEGAF